MTLPPLERTGAPSPGIPNTFNALSRLVEFVILTERDAKQRVHLAEYFVEVVQQCLGMRCVDAALAIHSSLKRLTLFRLKTLWEVRVPYNASVLNRVRKCRRRHKRQ